MKTSQRIAQSAVACIEPGVADQTIEDGYDGWMRRNGAFISTKGFARILLIRGLSPD